MACCCISRVVDLRKVESRVLSRLASAAAIGFIWPCEFGILHFAQFFHPLRYKRQLHLPPFSGHQVLFLHHRVAPQIIGHHFLL
jgi:hypothetical protein